MIWQAEGVQSSPKMIIAPPDPLAKYEKTSELSPLFKPKCSCPPPLLKFFWIFPGSIPLEGVPAMYKQIQQDFYKTWFSVLRPGTSTIKTKRNILIWLNTFFTLLKSSILYYIYLFFLFFALPTRKCFQRSLKNLLKIGLIFS